MVFFFGGLYTFRAKSWPYCFRSLQFPENVTVIFLQTLHILAKFKFHQSTYYGIIYLLTLLFYPSYGSMFGRVTNST